MIEICCWALDCNLDWKYGPFIFIKSFSHSKCVCWIKWNGSMCCLFFYFIFPFFLSLSLPIDTDCHMFPICVCSLKLCCTMKLCHFLCGQPHIIALKSSEHQDKATAARILKKETSKIKHKNWLFNLSDRDGGKKNETKICFSSRILSQFTQILVLMRTHTLAQPYTHMHTHTHIRPTDQQTDQPFIPNTFTTNYNWIDVNCQYRWCVYCSAVFPRH